MQYSIPLPANYDAGLIRERVNARRTLFDDHTGLIHKSFIYNEEDHLYAPFYVWRDVGQAQAFLLDDLFKGVIDTFRRHRVRSWIVLSMEYGDRTVEPTYALREIDVISPEADLKAFAKEEKNHQHSMLKRKGLYLHLTALDADRWEVMRYSLWRDAACAEQPLTDCCQNYNVLHVSEPKENG